jgi:hypothetical protein
MFVTARKSKQTGRIVDMPAMRPDNRVSPAVKTPFLHTFRNNLVGEYKAMAVTHGLNTYAVSVYEGRPCYVTGSHRISRRGQGRSAYNSYSVHFLDGSCQQIPAGKFNKAVKPYPNS